MNCLMTSFQICSRINNEKGSDRRFEKLFVSKDSSSADIPSQIFVDTAVYSRNRCFRLPLSSKAGKNSVLLPTGRFKCKNMVRNSFCALINESFLFFQQSLDICVLLRPGNLLGYEV